MAIQGVGIGVAPAGFKTAQLHGPRYELNLSSKNYSSWGGAGAYTPVARILMRTSLACERATAICSQKSIVSVGGRSHLPGRALRHTDLRRIDLDLLDDWASAQPPQAAVQHTH